MMEYLNQYFDKLEYSPVRDAKVKYNQLPKISATGWF